MIAAAFCMYNRYVDGLGTFAPDNLQRYAESARRIVEVGYQSQLTPSPTSESPKPQSANPAGGPTRSPA